MRDEFTFLRPAILLATSVLVFGVCIRTFREAGEQRAQAIEAMRTVTNTAIARAVTIQGTALVSRICPKSCSEDLQSTNSDCIRIH
jgi:hypothetical protein